MKVVRSERKSSRKFSYATNISTSTNIQNASLTQSGNYTSATFVILGTVEKMFFITAGGFSDMPERLEKNGLHAKTNNGILPHPFRQELFSWFEACHIPSHNERACVILHLVPDVQVASDFKAELTETNLKVFFKDRLLLSVSSSNTITPKQIKEWLVKYAAMGYLSVSDCCDVMGSLGELYDVDDWKAKGDNWLPVSVLLPSPAFLVFGIQGSFRGFDAWNKWNKSKLIVRCCCRNSSSTLTKYFSRSSFTKKWKLVVLS